MKARFLFVTVVIAATACVVPLADAQGPNQGGQGGQNNGPSDQAQLSEQEEHHLLSMREEEKLARDVYLAMFDLWEIDIFSNISESEQRHMDALKGLIDSYGLEDPVTDDTPGEFTNPVFSELYGQLVEAGSVSEVDALKVGALIEEMDIVDLRIAVSETEQADVLQVYDNLMRGSRNHLRSFAKLLAIAEETYEAQYLTQEEFDEIANSPMETGNGQSTGKQQGKGR